MRSRRARGLRWADCISQCVPRFSVSPVPATLVYLLREEGLEAIFSTGASAFAALFFGYLGFRFGFI